MLGGNFKPLFCVLVSACINNLFLRSTVFVVESLIECFKDDSSSEINSEKVCIPERSEPFLFSIFRIVENNSHRM